MENRIKKLLACGVLCWAVLVSTAAVWPAGKVSDYTADQVALDTSGKIGHQSKVYASGEKMRIEGFMPQSGSDLVVIIRRDLKKQWMLNPKQKTYFERLLEEQEIQGAFIQAVKNRTEKTLGQETVSGYACTKKQIEAEIEMMGINRKTRSVVWQSSEFDMPLRTQDESGRTTELRNIKEGRPAASLFEVSKDYKQVADIMELMGEKVGEGEGEAETPASGAKGGAGQFPIKLPPGVKLPFPKQ